MYAVFYRAQYIEGKLELLGRIPDYTKSPFTSRPRSWDLNQQPGHHKMHITLKKERTATIISIVHSLSGHTGRREGVIGRRNHCSRNCLKITSFRNCLYC